MSSAAAPAAAAAAGVLCLWLGQGSSSISSVLSILRSTQTFHYGDVTDLTKKYKC